MTSLGRLANMILERMRADDESDWPARLLSDLSNLPIVDEVPNASKWATSPDVSSAELRALDAVSRGLTYRMSGDLLGLAPDTVHAQLKAARYKLRAKNTVHAVAEAMRQGLIS